MTSLALVLMVLAAEPAPPPVPAFAVVVSKRINLDAEAALLLAVALEEALVREGVTPAFPVAEALKRTQALGLPDTAACQAKRECLGELGTQLNLAYLVALSATRVGNDTSVAFELVQVSKRAALEQETVVLSAPTLQASELAAFVARVKRRLTPAPLVVAKPKPRPDPTEDAPLQASLSPSGWVERSTDDTTVVDPVDAQPKHVGSFLLGAGALASLTAGAVLCVLSAQTAASLRGTATLSDGRVGSDLSGSQAREAAATATTQLGVGLGLGALGLGLGAGAVVAW